MSNQLHDFEVVLNGDTHRVRAATARDALLQFEGNEYLEVSDNEALYQYPIRNAYGSWRGDIYRPQNGERIYNPIRAGGYALVAYHSRLDPLEEPSHTLALVVGIEDSNALIVMAEGRHIGQELWIAIDGVDPPSSDGEGYSLGGYGGALCDYTLSANAIVAARAALLGA